VGSRRGAAHKEGLGRLGHRALDEVGRLPGEDVGEEVLGFAPVGDNLAVLVCGVIVQLLPVQIAVPLAPARRTWLGSSPG
jgi:hypothetical protein